MRGQRANHAGRVVVRASCVIVALLLTGCGAATAARTSATATPQSPTQTATKAALPTATPRPVVAFTCAPGSIPAATGATQVSCKVSEQNGAQVITVKFTGATYMDEAALTAAGWLHLDGAHGDGAVTSAGQDLWVNETAWLVSSWVGSSDGTSSLSVEASFPDGGARPIACGQSVAAGTTSAQGVPLPAGSFAAGQSGYLLAPACEADLQEWYATHLAGAGWSIFQPFMPPPGSEGATAKIMQATISQGNTYLYLRLSGFDGSYCEIVVMPAM